MQTGGGVVVTDAEAAMRSFSFLYSVYLPWSDSRKS